MLTTIVTLVALIVACTVGYFAPRHLPEFVLQVFIGCVIFWAFLGLLDLVR